MLIVLAIYFWMMQIYYGFFYVTRNSFVKLNFNTKQQLKINSLLEIETQFSSFIVSVIILSGLINNNYSHAFLSISIMFLFAFVLMVILRKRYGNEEHIPHTSTLKYNGIVGVLSSYTAIKNKKLIYFSIFSQSSFVIVLMTNIVDAYLLNNELNQTISSVGVLSIVYTSMAFLGSYVTRYINLEKQLLSIKITMGFMSLSMIYLALYPSYLNLIAITIIHGFCNPCAKVMINNLIMVNSTKDEVSRVFAISQGFTYLFRFLLSSILGVLLYKFGSSMGYLSLAIFGFICLAFILKINSTARTEEF